MDKKNLLIIGLVVVSLVLSGLAFTRPGQVVVKEITLGNSQNEDFVKNFNVGLFTAGFKDKDAATPIWRGATLTATATDICDNTVIRLRSGQATGTDVTMPTAANFTATGKCLTEIGDIKLVWLINDTAGSSTLINAASSTISALGFSTSTIAASGTVPLIGVRYASGTNPWIKWHLIPDFRNP